MSEETNRQVPGYYRFQAGDFEVTALNDGIGIIPFQLFTDTSENHRDQDMLKALTGSDYAPMHQEDQVIVPINVYLIQTRDHLILVDAGKGSAEGMIFLDKQGQLLRNLEASGFRAEDVDIILMTHLHSDHVGGVSEKGKKNFPNATIYMAETEKTCYLDTPIDDVPKAMQDFFTYPRQALAPYLSEGKIRTFQEEEELFPGIRAIPIKGHTPGHTGFLISSKGMDFLIWGDLAHVKSVQLPEPDISLIIDYDPKEAANTRKTRLPEFVQQRLLVAGIHMPFPGVGHIAKDGDGYRWVPIEYMNKIM